MRVDVPTLQCDRCKTTTQDIRAMGSYVDLIHYPPSGGKELKWDLCQSCWRSFDDWMSARDE